MANFRHSPILLQAIRILSAAGKWVSFPSEVRIVVDVDVPKRTIDVNVRAWKIPFHKIAVGAHVIGGYRIIVAAQDCRVRGPLGQRPNARAVARVCADHDQAIFVFSTDSADRVTDR
jgi:hypothetical protein